MIRKGRMVHVLLVMKIKLSVLVQLVNKKMIKKQETRSRMVRFFQMHSPTKQKLNQPRFAFYFDIVLVGAHTKPRKLDFDLAALRVRPSCIVGTI